MSNTLTTRVAALEQQNATIIQLLTQLVGGVPAGNAPQTVTAAPKQQYSGARRWNVRSPFISKGVVTVKAVNNAYAEWRESVDGKERIHRHRIPKGAAHLSTGASFVTTNGVVWQAA